MRPSFHVERLPQGPRPWAVVAIFPGDTLVAVVVATFDRVADAMAEAVRREAAA